MKKTIKKSIMRKEDHVVIREYDENGNLIHYKDSKGEEGWWDYDNNGNETHYKDSDEEEYWYEYDNNGNCIHFKDSIGEEWWHEYDENGNEIHYKNNQGYEYWKEYDENNNLIHYKDSNNNEEWWDYDEYGNEIHYKDSDGDEVTEVSYEYEYYEDYLTIEELGKKIIDSIEVEEIQVSDTRVRGLLPYRCKAKYNGKIFEAEYGKEFPDKLDNYHIFIELVFNSAYVPSDKSGEVFAKLFNDEEMNAIYAYYRNTEEFHVMEEMYFGNEEED